MRTARTTRCCSALALSAALVSAASAAPDRPPLTLFPLEPVWRVTLEPALAAAPAYDDRHVYLPLANGQLAAHRLKDGVQSWIHDDAVTSSPAAGDNFVFVPTAAAITALRVADGTVAWQIHTEIASGSLVWKSGWLFAPTKDGVVHALRASDGVEVWRAGVGGPPHARLTVVGDRIYVPTADGRLLSLDVLTGRQIWERKLGGPASEAAAAGDRVYVGSADNFFYCLDARDGSVQWRWRTGADVIGAPAVDADYVYFVSLDNVLRALNRHSGVQRWMQPLDERPAFGPLASPYLLTVSGRTPSLNAFDIRDGRPGGSLTAAGDLVASPHLFSDPSRPLPLLLVLTGNPAGGTTMSVYTRAIEPRIMPVSPLPNLVRIGSGSSSSTDSATRPPAPPTGEPRRRGQQREPTRR